MHKQAGAKCALPAEGLVGLFSRLDQVAVKPITVSLQLTDAAMDLDVKDMLRLFTDSYMRTIEEGVARQIVEEKELALSKDAMNRVSFLFSAFFLDMHDEKDLKPKSGSPHLS